MVEITFYILKFFVCTCEDGVSQLLCWIVRPSTLSDGLECEARGHDLLQDSSLERVRIKGHFAHFSDFAQDRSVIVDKQQCSSTLPTESVTSRGIRPPSQNLSKQLQQLPALQ